jgi:hypothetical protein
MRQPWRPLALAAMVILTAAGAASAQTVIATNAPASTKVEVVLNGTTVGTAAADAAGHATIPVNLAANAGGKTETDVYMYVDICADLRRVIIAERGQQPSAPGDGCERRDLGLFLLRRISTVVVNMGGLNPTVLLVQGRFDPREPRPVRGWNAAPGGLVLWGGGMMRTFRDAKAFACGNLSDCSGGGFNTGGVVGATYWVKPFMGADVSFMKPAEALIDGSGDGFEFTTRQDVRFVTLGGTIGIPTGPTRVYGRGGATFHQGTFATTQRTEDTTVTVDGVTSTIPGGTQTFELKTEGWSWYFGGGLEVWVKRRLAIYGEATFSLLKGEPVDESDGAMDERVTAIMLGVKFHIGG